MKRVLFTIIAATSLTIAVGVCVLWARSYRFKPSQVGESINFHHSDPYWWVVSNHGELTFCRQHGKDWGPEFPGMHALGVRFGGHNGPNGSLWNLVVPHAYVAALLLSPPAWWLVTFRHDRRRRRPGLCRHCGYDLRSSPDRCPECGAPAAPTVTRLPAGATADTSRPTN